MNKKWSFVLASCLVSGCASAPDWDARIGGDISFAVQQNGNRQTPLVVEPDRFKIETQYVIATPVINFEVASDKLRIEGQVRGEIQRGGDFNDERGVIDELYAEYMLTSSLFVFAGRRNVAFGQAESSYMLDVFVDPLEINTAKNINRRRREVVGENMAGFEMLLTSELAFAGYVLPEQDQHHAGEHSVRGLATLSWLLPWQADAQLLVLDDDRSGVGFAYTQTLGDALLLYAEGMRRDRRDRGRITTQNMNLTTHLPDNESFGQLILGGNYIFANNLALTVEYSHDENGYSDAEWEDIANIISASNAVLANTNPAIYAPARGNLLRLNDALRHYTLRQNYAFLRLSHPDFVGLAIASEFSTFHNLDDDSGIASARFEIDLNKGSVGLYARSAYGNEGKEFKLRGANQMAMVYWTLQF